MTYQSVEAISEFGEVRAYQVRRARPEMPTCDLCQSRKAINRTERLPFRAASAIHQVGGSAWTVMVVIAGTVKS